MIKNLVNMLRLSIVFLIVVACQDGRKQQPCRLFIYSSYSKIYQIDFNGIDSVRTVCGELKCGSFDKRGRIVDIHSPFSCIYMQKAQKIEPIQSRNLNVILNRLNNRIITDTVKGEIKDVWNICLVLDKQIINLQTAGIKDGDIQMLVDSLKEYSPLFINDYSNGWFGIDAELEMIRMYDKRKDKY